MLLVDLLVIGHFYLARGGHFYFGIKYQFSPDVNLLNINFKEGICWENPHELLIQF